MRMAKPKDRKHKRLEKEFYPLQGRYLNVGCGHDIRPKEEGWVNLDGYHDDPRVIRHDLIDTPWPFLDNSFDVIYASHVLEHIPLLFQNHRGTQRDVFFAVMEEIHRVLKPGGILHLRVPHAKRYDLAFCHPQHYRFWTLNWFRYFLPGEQETYYSSARFRIEAHHTQGWGARWGNLLPIRGWGVTYHLRDRMPFLGPLLNIGEELIVFARVVKEEPFQESVLEASQAVRF